ncbi:MAG: YicC family protein [Firmicutes bacterium]|jgi:uncharacterized protein (TIGR00255 family)|nr:YicC/YloC family endoribonuclease [Bacillota bacterium]NLL89331.1 YicC family protein [Bacillota bacterium]HKM16613.1 YicC/YloC family endoribonuclease [Limnochordia bacterium]
MVFSMTGFGSAEVATDQWVVKVEIRSVNHRYLDIQIRLPRQYQLLEETLRRLVAVGIQRGRVEVYLRIEELGQQDRIVKIDKGILAGLYKQWQELQQEMRLPDLTFDHVFQIPDLIEITDPVIDWDLLTAVTKEAVTNALEQLNAMRTIEGQRLAQDLVAKMDRIAQLVEEIESHAPQVVANYRTRLKERLDELLAGTSLSPERFEAEVALFADRCSIDEEWVRMRSHIEQFLETLKQRTPIGRKLDFLIQEMNRETNTIGSKASDIHITKAVVELKSELEKAREQVQNLE